MHREIEVTVPSEPSRALADRLAKMETVIAVALSPKMSLKPPGDVLVVKALNRGAGEVVRAISDAQSRARVVTATSDIASLTDKENTELIENDTDEELWEKLETGLRHT